ncbi:uncharacterized protein LOC141595000 [Silene latifolia]|uniref:uncharacterized protein LOC141595000 n=1 Tax=Silene latifolia TaxID=37657 RepID=UPI003D77009E
MTDYFSKWIEAEAMTEVKEQQVISFIKRNIISRFGIPSEIICDNGSQFISITLKASYTMEHNTEKVSPRIHKPTAAESKNKIIVENLGSGLEELGENGRTNYHRYSGRDNNAEDGNRQTPFSPYTERRRDTLEVPVPTHDTVRRTADQNKVEMTRSLDTVDELRESAYIRMASYKQSVARTYNKNVRIRTLEVGDLVLRRVFENTKNHKAGKFAYKWEGPYQVESIIKNGAYSVALEHHETAPGNLHYFGLYNASTKKGFGTNVGYLSDEAHLEGPAPAM